MKKPDKGIGTVRSSSALLTVRSNMSLLPTQPNGRDYASVERKISSRRNSKVCQSLNA